MATFNQWSAKHALRQITWACGPEPVLAAEVVAAYRQAISPDVTFSLFADETPEVAVWDEVLALPPDGGRLIVVYGAEKLHSIMSFEVLAEAEGMDTAFTVFVSAEGDFARLPGEGRRKLAPHLAALQACKRAQLVRCVAPSKDEDKLKLVTSWWPGAGANLAHDLVVRCGGDLGLAREACLKAVLGDWPPAAASLDYVATADPGHSYVDALLASDRRLAAIAARSLPRLEVGYTLAVLATSLGQLAALHEAKARGMTAAEIAAKLRMDRFAQHRLSPLAAGYSPARVRECRKLIAWAESQYRNGAGDALPEVIAANW